MTLIFPDGRQQKITVADLKNLPATAVSNCFIVSTGHGTSGPFTFTGVTLWLLVDNYYDGPWQQLEVISADGFGNRIWRHELEATNLTKPILLAYESNGRPLTRQKGLVRLIVPSEQDDALRQVKWVQEIKIRPYHEQTT
jgi:DMSO/TMAO reductase YedYZ molybdopterin-dependent catalytic subunit